MTATWTTPITWTNTEFITAARMNQQVRDNLDWLKSPAAVGVTGSSDITTTSTTQVDMTGMTGSLFLTGSRLLVGYVGALRASGVGVTAKMGINIDTGISTLFESIPNGAVISASWVVRVGSLTFPDNKSMNVQWSTAAATLAQDGATYMARRFFACEVL